MEIVANKKKKGLVVIDGREYSEAEWKTALEELYRTRFRVAIEILVMTRDRFLQNNEFTYEQLDRLWSLLENVITLSQDGLNSLGEMVGYPEVNLVADLDYERETQSGNPVTAIPND